VGLLLVNLEIAMYSKDISDYSLNMDPAWIVGQYSDPIFRKIGNTVHIGYLVQDDCPDNPLESMDGMGRIHRMLRDSCSEERSKGLKAVGRDQYGDKDFDQIVYALEGVEGKKAFEILKGIWVKEAVNCPSFIRQLSGTKTYEESYLRRKASQILNQWKQSNWYGGNGDNDPRYYSLWDNEVALMVWNAFRDLGLIGEKLGVVLDVYIHSGESWSVSGEGMNCRWDTSRGAGIWVPDSCARDEIERRGAVYAFGKIDEMIVGGVQSYIVRTNDCSVNAKFDQWGNAFAYLEEISKGKKSSPSDNAQGVNCAKFEIARQGVDLYNKYISGDTYGICWATFEVDEDGGNPKFIDDDSVWGFYGQEDAEAGLIDHCPFDLSQKEEEGRCELA